MNLKNLGGIAGEVMFPERFTCELCGRDIFDGGKLCGDCAKTVEFNDGATCLLCGRKVDADGVCIECKASPPLYKKAVSALVYADGAQRLVTGFKNGKRYLKEYFADIMRDKLIGFEKIDCIIPVPMTEKSVKKRGYNQSELLARSLSERVYAPVILNAVVKNADTREQKSLSRKEREQNLSKCFEVKDRKAVKGKRVLIVDDVLTTGATADALTGKLYSAGAKSVYLATVASVEYKPVNR